jgi:putative transposase
MDYYALSERHACKLLDMDRSSYRYESRPDHNSLLREELITLARQRPRFGYRRLWALLVKRGHQVNVKRVYRLYRQEHLAVHRPKRKRLERAAPVNALMTAPNQEWGLDFVSDAAGEWPRASHSDCGRRVHARVSGLGSGHQPGQPVRHTGAGARDR